MFSIGDFAKLGRVSVRMLRHYDAIGLMRPAEVDPSSGYRSYRAEQLRRLNRVIALKDLGFTLQQVQAILDDQVGVDQLRGMLRLRRAQLEDQLAADAARLAGVEARLRMIEREGFMNTDDVVLKEVPAVRVAELSGVAASYASEHIGPVIGPLFQQLFGHLEVAGVMPAGAPVAYYEPANGPGEGTEAVLAHAAVPVAGEAAPDQAFRIVDLPAIPTAATIVHHGSMDDADSTMEVLGQWIEDNGYRMEGFAREVTLEFDPDDPSKWVHEFQMKITR
jgi:DNA-binding transcriptional MerR regulator